jgi:probable HAF family extracellular repeat protein
MRKTLLGASALISVALLASSSAQAAPSYIPIALPNGAVSVAPFGINDDNIIAGSYTDSGGVQHGFYGPPDGSKYKTFDLQGVTGTQPRGIRIDKSITGLALASGFTFGEEFYRSPDGTIKLLKNPKGDIQDGVAQGGNDNGVYVGDYLDTDGVRRIGFKGKAGKFKSKLNLPLDNLTSTNPRQINNLGVVAGGYIGSDGIQHGFVLDGDNLTSFDHPDAAGVTVAEGINDKGQVTGLWQDSGGNRHGFLYDVSTAKFKAIDPGDGSTFQEAWGINNKGLIVGDTSNGFAFIYCPLKPTKCPKGAPAGFHPAHAKPLKKPINLP